MSGLINVRDKAILWARDVLNNKDKYVILNTETSGLNRNDVVLDLAVIDIDGNILFNSRIKPSKRKRISKEATAIHGITMAHLKECPTFGEIKNQVESLIDGKKAIIYNAEFDEKIIRQTCDQDECGYFRMVYDSAMKHYSSYIAEWGYYYGSSSYQRLPENDITALGDCYAVLKLIKKMAETPLSEKGQVSLLGKSSQSSSGSPRFQRVVKKKSGKAWWKFW